MTELHTSRLLLRPCRPDDAPCYALGIGEFDVARWLPATPWPYTLAMAADWLRQAPPASPEQALFIIDLPGKGLIGCVSLLPELGFWIARPHWSRGYASEAATAVLAWYFTGSTNETISASAMRNNAASLRVQSRLGFQEIARKLCFSQALQHNVEIVQTRLTRTQFLAGDISRCA